MIFGDAVGHGINDSLAAIISMTVFNASVSEDPLEILTKINRALCITKDQVYCICIKIQDDKVFYSGKVEEAKLGDINFTMNCNVLGASEKYTCRTKTLKFKKKDVLRLRTDGAVFEDETDDQCDVIIRKEGMIA